MEKSISKIDLEKKIIEASLKMFFSQGIKAVSMDDVAHAVGISKRTLYEVFTSKDELLVKCINFMQEQHEHKAICEGGNFIEIALRHVNDALSFMQNINPSFFVDLARINYRSASESYSKSMEKRRQKTSDLLAQGQQQGLIRQDVDIRLISDILMSPDNGLISNLVATGHYAMSHIMQSLCLLFIRGIATEKGIKEVDRLMSEYNSK